MNKIRNVTVLMISTLFILSVFTIAMGSNCTVVNANNQAICTDTPIIEEKTFIPDSLAQELERAVILKNPPEMPVGFYVPPPEFLDSSDNIPPTYPARLNDGESFLP